ncbi:hypothetical protein THAOC_33460, partial [Thalassiosira oceanica]
AAQEIDLRRRSRRHWVFGLTGLERLDEIECWLAQGGGGGTVATRRGAGTGPSTLRGELVQSPAVGKDATRRRCSSSCFRPALAAAAASEPPEDKTGRIDGRRAQLLSFWSGVGARQSARMARMMMPRRLLNVLKPRAFPAAFPGGRWIRASYRFTYLARVSTYEAPAQGTERPPAMYCLAQLVERTTLNRVVVGSIPTLGVNTASFLLIEPMFQVGT